MSENLELYKIFYTVAYYKNISQAARVLYVSQPAVSQAIKKLEKTIGIQLFARGSKGVALTPEGKTFYEYIEKGLAIISNGENVLAELKNKKQGIISIGVSTTLCRRFLLPYLKPFMNRYPDIQIRIVNKTTFDTLKQIEQGDIDFGIVSQPFDLNKYVFMKIIDIQDIFAAESEYLKAANIIDPNDIFTKCKFMLLEADNITRQYINQYFFENNIFIKPEIEINTMDFLIDFAKIGLGVAVVIRSFIEQELASGSLVEIPVTPKIPARSVGVIYDKNTPLSIAAQTFLSYFTSAFHKKTRLAPIF